MKKPGIVQQNLGDPVLLTFTRLDKAVFDRIPEDAGNPTPVAVILLANQGLGGRINAYLPTFPMNCSDILSSNEISEINSDCKFEAFETPKFILSGAKNGKYGKEFQLNPIHETPDPNYPELVKDYYEIQDTDSIWKVIADKHSQTLALALQADGGSVALRGSAVEFHVGFYAPEGQPLLEAQPIRLLLFSSLKRPWESPAQHPGSIPTHNQRRV